MLIDPLVLRARTNEVAARLANPAACASAIRRLLEDYTDRTHRLSPRLAEMRPDGARQTPAPVTRALLAALRKPAQASPEEALALAKALWAGGTRPERVLAAQVLGLVASRLPDETLALADSWVTELDSLETVEAVVNHVFGPLLAGAQTQFLQRARGWSRQPQKWVRCLGITVLSALARERKWDDVLSALELLRPLMGESDPNVRAAIITALRNLARRNAPETARFLLEFAHRSDHNTHMIVRGALRALPEADQAQLLRALRGSGSTGVAF
ncbi:MAG: DNA alkylation repair protein [Anaerolineales bacterium]|nr:DNA alkylation repair protein [Anaerolineales bacterium]